MAYIEDPLFTEPILLTGRVGTLGVVHRVVDSCWPSDNTLVLRPGLAHDYDFVRMHLERIDYTSLNRGSTQPLLTQGDLAAQKFVCPPPFVREQYCLATVSLFERQTISEKESGTLSYLRDTLLPKLISGELRVPDAEKLLAESPV